MNQESFGKLIKNLRKKNNLTQKDLANKYGVTYQAVSKWENGLNMPDITLIKQISEDFNVDLDSMLEGNYATKQKSKIKKWIIYVLLFIIVILIGITIFYRLNGGFESKTLTTTCQDFNLSGSASYNNEKLAIHIFNIEYCGQEDKKYQRIECTLYEKDTKKENEINSLLYEGEAILLEDYLKDVKFSVDNYVKMCKTYDNDNLYIKITAIDENSNKDNFLVPITLEENCSNSTNN